MLPVAKVYPVSGLYSSRRRPRLKVPLAGRGTGTLPLDGVRVPEENPPQRVPSPVNTTDQVDLPSEERNAILWRGRRFRRGPKLGTAPARKPPFGEADAAHPATRV